MNVDDFISSPEFLLFLDEDLRRLAEKTVDAYLGQHDKGVKNSQLYSIPAALAAGGLQELQSLAEHQADKNAKSGANDKDAPRRDFWEMVKHILSVQDSSKEASSLQKEMRSLLGKRGLLIDEDEGLGKVKARQARKENRKLFEKALEVALPVYFEHFNCHYFYKASDNGERRHG